ncbi:MAG: hypothetical protein EOO42_06355 [Flavobacteriales bacterium]|nr:MAG: hypothetical protein EOO42_06355 [Flavobacteriales bacterium]
MMKQEDLFKKLGLILNELNEQYQFLSQNPQQLNELELELFHANASFLTDHVQIVKKIALSQSQPALLTPPPVVEEKIEEIPAAYFPEEDVHEEEQLEAVTFVTEEPVEVIKEEAPVSIIEKDIFKLDDEPATTFEFILNDHADDDKFDFERKDAHELFDRQLSEAEERILAEKKAFVEPVNLPVVEAVEETPVFEEEDEIGPEPFLVHVEEEPIAEEVTIMAEDLTLEEAPIAKVEVNITEPVEDPTFKPTLNDILAGKTTANSVNTNATASISDLKQAISLNDKLLYIKDLFNGYNLAYAEAIDLANKLPNFEAADNFFQKNYAVKNGWSEKQATVDKFYQLLNQRFK